MGSQRHGTLLNIPFLKVISSDSSFGRCVSGKIRLDNCSNPTGLPHLPLSLSVYLLQVRPIFTKCRPGFAVPGTVPSGEGEHPRPTYRHALDRDHLTISAHDSYSRLSRHTCHLPGFRRRFRRLPPGLVKCSHQLSFGEGLPGAGTRGGHFPIFSCHTQHSFSPALSTTVTEHESETICVISTLLLKYKVQGNGDHLCARH